MPVAAGMESQDFQYLLRMRAHYTPQQLQAINEVMWGKSSAGEEFNWTDFVLTLSRKTETMKVETHRSQPPELSTIIERED